MYFHFRSKHALASAIIEEQSEIASRAATEVFGRRLSGFETVVDLWYLIAVHDVSDVMARAGMNLLEEIGRAGVMKAKLVNEWLDGFSMILRRAIDEGDVMDSVGPTPLRDYWCRCIWACGRPASRGSTQVLR